MLKSVEITNFKNIRHQLIELEPLTVFVGANGSGKTSVLNAIHFADLAATPTSTELGGDPASVFTSDRHCDWLYSRRGKGDLSISCEKSNETITVSASRPSEFPPPQAEQFGRGQWRFEVKPEVFDRLDGYGLARSLVFLRLDATKLSNPSYSNRTPPELSMDGEGLGPVLAYMALNDPDGFDRLVEEMRRLIPQLKRIRFTKRPVYQVEKEIVRFGDDSVERQSNREYQGDAILFDFQNANNVSAHTVGEGTLMLLGLLAILLGPSKPDILLLDDIERGLHPLAQKSLVELLTQIMSVHPQLQILATAHSPYLIDYLKPEQVRLMTTRVDGYSVCGKLTEHPQFEKWKDEMAPGEFWSLFGEKWIAEGAHHGE